MASLGNALVEKILGHSAAEKAFRPWWDNLEDYLTYGLVLLGLIVAPTAIINSTPLDCTPCQADRCPDDKFRTTYDDEEAQSHADVDASKVNQKDINAWWVKKFCTMTAVDEFIMYFPYILLIMAFVIVLIEKMFVRLFRAGLKLDMFYNLLVKEALEDEFEGVGDQHNVGVGGDAVDSSSPPSALAAVAASDMENSKQAIEVSQTFSQSTNYYYSYLLRLILFGESNITRFL